MRQRIVLKINQDYYLRFVAIIIGILNVLTVNNQFAASGLIGAEVIILVLFFVRKKYTDYIGFYCISFCLCMEFGIFVNNTTFYSLKNTRLFGINLGIWLLFPLAFLGIINWRSILSRNQNGPVYKFARRILVLMAIAIVMGLITIVTNDNNIGSLPNLTISFVNEIYTSFLITAFSIFSMIYMYYYDKLEIEKMENYLVAVIFGTMAQIVVSSTLGIYGYYGGVRTILVCTLSFIAPLFPVVLVFYFVNKDANVPINIIELIISFYCLFIAVVNNANGKMIIMTIACPVLIYLILRGRYGRVWIIVLPSVPLLLYAIIRILVKQSADSILLYSKLDQVISLFRLGSGDWFETMESSPKFRVAEFTNVVIEYIKKPWFSIFGKGVLGTILDYTNSFGESYKAGTFSKGEWSIGAFYSMHLVPASFMLWNGIVGLYFYISTIVKNLRMSNKNCLLLVGTVWFAVFYGYSSTLTVYGIIILIIGYFEIEEDIRNEKNFNPIVS